MFYPDDLAPVDPASAPPEEVKTPALDVNRPSSYLANDWWAKASPDDRSAAAPNAFLNWEKSVKDAGPGFKAIQKSVAEDGTESDKEIQVFKPNGAYTPEGLDWVSNVKNFFDVAGKIPDGGVYANKYTNTVEPNEELDSMMIDHPANRKEMFPGLDSWVKDKQAIEENGQKAKMTFGDYVSHYNEDHPDEQLDASNPQAKEYFDKSVARMTFDPKTMKDDEIVREVGGAYMINPKRYTESATVEAAIKGIKGISASDRKLMMINYQNSMDGVEPTGPAEGIGDLVRGGQVAFSQTPELLYGVGALLGDTADKLTGYGKGFRDWSLKGYQDSQRKHAPLARENDDVIKAWENTKNGDYGALLDWAQYGLGYTAGQMLETAGMVAVGGVVGGASTLETGPGAVVGAGGGMLAGLFAKGEAKALAKKFTEELIAKQAGKMAAKELGEAATAEGIKALAGQAVMRSAAEKQLARVVARKAFGETAAAMTNAGVMELGSIYPEAVQKAKEEGRELNGMDLARVWGAGLAATITEGATEKFGLDLIKGKHAEFLSKIAGGKLGGALAGGAIDAFAEGSTELAQTFLERLGARQSIGDSEAQGDYINSTLQGALGGAVVGGVGGGIHGEEYKGLTAVGFVQQTLPTFKSGIRSELSAASMDAANMADFIRLPDVSLKQKATTLLAASRKQYESSMGAAAVDLPEDNSKPATAAPNTNTTPPVEPNDTPKGKDPKNSATTPPAEKASATAAATGAAAVKASGEQAVAPVIGSEVTWESTKGKGQRVGTLVSVDDTSGIAQVKMPDGSSRDVPVKSFSPAKVPAAEENAPTAEAVSGVKKLAPGHYTYTTPSGNSGSVKMAASRDSEALAHATSLASVGSGSKAPDIASASKADIGKTDFNPQTGAVFIETTSKKSGKKYAITAELSNGVSGKSEGRTKWIISNEDSKSPGEYSGSIPMELAESRSLAVEALGEDFVNSVEESHRDADKNGFDGSERAEKKIQEALKSISPKPNQTKPNDGQKNDSQEALPEADAKGKVLSEGTGGEQSPSVLTPTNGRVDTIAKGKLLVKTTAQLEQIAKDSGLEAKEHFAARSRLEDLAKGDGQRAKDAKQALKNIEDHFSQAKPKLDAARATVTEEALAGYGENPVYVVAPNLLNRESGTPTATDETGGTWAPRSDGTQNAVFEYTPGPGKTMPFGVGTVVAVGGDNNNVLVLHSIQNNKFVFKLIDTQAPLNHALGQDEVRNLHQLSDNWNANRLHNIARQLVPHLGKLLGKGEVTDDVFTKMMNGVLSIVAPGYDPKSLRYEELPEGSYFSTGTDPSSDKAFIVVDKKKMVSELRDALGDYETGKSATYDMLTANELARQLSTWTDEEQFHRVVLEEFTQEGDDEKLVGFIDEIAASGGNTSNVARMMRDFLTTTASQRKMDVNNLTDDQKRNLTHEILRKMGQMGRTGTFSEMQNLDSQMLQKALNEDEKKNNGKGDWKGFKTVMELLRRYMRKMQNILTLRALSKQLTPIQKELLQRANASYNRANLDGDVDMISAKVAANDVWTHERYKEQSNNAITKVAFEDNHTEALTALKRMVGATPKFAHLSLEELIIPDEVNGTLSLNPEIRSYLEEHESKAVNLADLDSALSALNAISNGKRGRDETYLVKERGGESSVRMVQTQLILARRRLESARALVKNILPMLDGTELDQITQTDRNGEKISDDKRRNLILENGAKIRKFLDEAQTQSGFHDANNALLLHFREEADRVQNSWDKSVWHYDHKIINDIHQADVETVEGINQLMDLAEKIGFESDPTKFIHPTTDGVDPHEYWKESMADFAFNESQVRPGSIAAKVDPSHVNESNQSYGDSLKFYNDQIHEVRLRMLHEKAAETKQDSVNNDFNRLVSYYGAMREYNETNRNFVRLALGDAGVDTRMHGLSFTDNTFKQLKGDDVAQALIAKWNKENKPDAGVSSASAATEEIPEATEPGMVFGFPYYGVRTGQALQSRRMETDEFGVREWKHKVATDWIIRREYDGKTNPYHTLLHSNANSVGKDNWRKLFLSILDGNTSTKDDVNQITQTGGFSIDFKSSDPDSPGRSLEGWQVFPSMDHSGLFFWGDHAFSDTSLDKLKAKIGESRYQKEMGDLVLRDEERDDDLAFLNPEGEQARELSERNKKKAYNGTLMGMLDGLTDWMKHIEATMDDGMVERFGETLTSPGIETLAGRTSKLLLPRITEAKQMLIAYRNHVEQTLAGLPDGRDALRGNDKVGNLVSLDWQDDADPVQHPFNDMFRAFRLLHSDVSAARSAFQGFSNPQWRKNIRREASRESRDAGYSSTKDFKFIRDYSGDVVTDSMMEWYLEHFAGASRKYKLTPYYASEAMLKWDKTNWSNDGLEKFQSQQFKWQNFNVWQRDAKGEVVFSQAKDPEKDPNDPTALLFTDAWVDGLKIRVPLMVPQAELDIHGEPKTYKEWVPATMDEESRFAYSVTEKDHDGRSIMPFGNGEQSVKPSDAPKEWIAKRMDDPDRMRRAWFSENSLLIGMRINPDRRTAENARQAVDNARMFRDDLARVNGNTLESIVAQAVDGMFGTSETNLDRRIELMDEFLKDTRWGNVMESQRLVGSGIADVGPTTFSAKIDPVELLHDLVNFKSGKELAFADKMRMLGDDVAHNVGDMLSTEIENLSGDSVPNHFTTLDELNAIKVQFEQIKKTTQALKKDPDGNIIGGGFPIFHASVLRESDQHYVSSNQGLSLLLQNTKGDVLVYAPQRPAYVDGTEVGVRYFPAKDGKPGLIYAPQSSTTETSREDTRRLMVQAMREHTQNKDVERSLSEFSASVREQMKPFMQIDRIANAIRGDTADLLALAKEGASKVMENPSEALQTLYAHHLVSMHKLMEQHGLAFRRQDLKVTPVNGKTHTVKNQAVSSTTIDPAAVGYKDGTYSNEDNIILFTELMTNPKFKEAYDMTFFGNPVLNNTTLGDHSINAIIQSVLGVRAVRLEDGDAYYEDKNSDDDSADSSGFEEQGRAPVKGMADLFEHSQNDESANANVNGRGDLTDDGLESDAPLEENLDEADEALDDVQANDLKIPVGKGWQASQGKNAPLSLSQSYYRIKEELAKLDGDGFNLGQLDGKMLSVLDSTKDAWDGDRITPGDAALINLFNAVLMKAKVSGEQAQIGYQAGSNRQILGDHPTHEAARPMLPGINSDGIYNGSWGSLLLSRNEKGHTFSTINFASNRREGFLAAMLSLSPSVDEHLSEATKPALAEAIRRYEGAIQRRTVSEQEEHNLRESLKTKKLAKTGDPSIYYTKKESYIPLSEQIFEELGNLLPEGMLDRHFNESYSRIHGLMDADGTRKGGLLNELKDAKQRVEDSRQTIERVNAEITDKDLSDQFESLDNQQVQTLLMSKAEKAIKAKLASMRKKIELGRSRMSPMMKTLGDRKVDLTAVERLLNQMDEKGTIPDHVLIERFKDLIDKGFRAEKKNVGKNSAQRMFSDMVRELVPTREERMEFMADSGKMDAGTQDTLRQAEVRMAQAQANIEAINKTLSDIKDRSTKEWRIGNTAYKHEIKDEFTPDAMVPVEMNFIPSGLDAESRLLREASSSMLAKKFDALSDEDKYEFYIKMRAMERALHDFADNGAEASYKLLRGDSEYFNSVSPSEMIHKAVASYTAEINATRERIRQWRNTMEQVGYDGSNVDPDALAVLADPEMLGSIITVSGTKRQNAVVKLLRSPQGAEERRELFGHLVKDNDSWIVLAPTNVRKDLQDHFGTKGKGSNTGFRRMVLDSLPVSQSSTSGQRMGFSTENEPFTMDLMVHDVDSNGRPVSGTERNVNGQTRKEVADQLISNFKNQYIALKNDGMDADDPRAIKADNEQVAGVLANYEYMIRNIIYSHDHELLSEDTTDYLNQNADGSYPALAGTKTKVSNFIKGLASDSHARSTISLQDMHTKDVFSRVFSEIEGSQIMDRLISGLVTNPKDHALFMAKYFHHQDARRRAMFVKDFASVQEAARMQDMIDMGFDGKSGRTGYKLRLNKITDRLAEARKALEHGPLVGASSLDQSKARMWAWLEGMKMARGGELHSRFGSEIDIFRRGSDEFMKLHGIQKAKKGVMAHVSGFFHDEHVDLMRDEPMLKQMLADLMPILTEYEKGIPNRTGVLAEVKNQWALGQIEKAQAKLLSNNAKSAEIHNYGKVLVDVFKGVTDALDIARGLSFDPEAVNDKSNKTVTEFGSIVPLLYQHANMPGAERIDLENKYKEDPLEMVAIGQASMLGGAGRASQKKTSKVLRPVNINGLSGIDALLDDAVYRINVAPNYQVLRATVGRRVQDMNTKMDVIQDSMIADQWNAKNDTESFNWDQRRRDQAKAYIKKGKIALAAVASEIENDVENDSRQGVTSTHVAETSKFLASMFISKALTSISNVMVQTVPAIVFTPVKKLMIGDVQGAKDFLGLLSHYGASSIARTVDKMMFGHFPFKGEFATNMDKAVENLSPWTTFREADGMDQNRIVGRRTNRYGQGRTMKIVGRVFKELETLQEKGLEVTIAKGERTVSRPMFMMELVSEMRKMQREYPSIVVPSIDDIVNGRLAKDQIPPDAINYARMKVNDMFGQADQAKKAKPFQTWSTNAGWNAVLKSVTRFSNQTATASSNLTSLLPMLPKTPSQIKDYVRAIRDQNNGTANIDGAMRMRQEAVENFVGTIGQNILFHFIKPRVLIPLLGYAIYGIGGDDDDDAMEKAIETSNKIMAPNEDDPMMVSILKAMSFGNGTPIFQDWKDPEAARRSAYAQIMSQTMGELLNATPGVGVLGGYSMFGNIEQPFTDAASEWLATLGSDLKVAKDNKSPDAVRIYDGDKNALEYAAQLTAPTMALYDLADGARASIQSANLDEVSKMDQAVLWATQIWAPRELRTMIKSKMDKAIRDNE